MSVVDVEVELFCGGGGGRRRGMTVSPVEALVGVAVVTGLGPLPPLLLLFQVASESSGC